MLDESSLNNSMSTSMKSSLIIHDTTGAMILLFSGILWASIFS